MKGVNKIIAASVAQIVNMSYAYWFLFNCTGSVSRIITIKGCFIREFNHVIARNIPIFKTHMSIIAAIIIAYSLYCLHQLLKSKEIINLKTKTIVGICLLINVTIGGFLILFSLAIGLDA